MHSLLKRQLRKIFGAEDAVPATLAPLVEAVDEAYRQFDDDRLMLERSLELSSQELLQANTEMRAVFRLFPDLFFRLKIDGTILDCNTGKTDHLRAGPGDMIGKKIQSVPTPEVGRLFDDALRRIRERQETVMIEYSMQVRGTERHYEASLLPLLDHQIIVFIRDITTRKTAEAERDRLVTAIEQAAESITITDTSGTIQYVNPAFERITGFSRAEAIGRNPRMLKSDQHDASFYAEMWSTLENGHVWRGQFVDKKKDGSLLQIESAISPIRDSRGMIVNYVMVGHDVTREVQLEDQLRQSHKMEAIGRLAGGIAHDFNNLLTAIIGNAELVLSRITPADPLRDDVEEIKKASMRAAALTSQLLAFGRRQVLHPKAISLNQIITEMERLLQRVLGENIELKTDLSDDLWPVRADPVQIEQVIMNLSINARDAMPQGGSLSISTSNHLHDARPGAAAVEMPVGDYAVIRVTDSGVGMDESTRRRLFEPFFTTKEMGKGTGLGLATVYGIVKQSDGHITVDSKPGVGSIFTIYLPRSREAAAHEKSKAAVAPMVTGAETILLVEDEEQVRRLTRTLLERHGYHILEARQGAEAIDIAESFDGKIHLMLTDVIMPGLSGDLLARRIANIRPATRILFMSGHPDSTVTFQGVLADARRFIKKPFSSTDLARKVREVLDEK